jgi:hypothetical protein
MGFEQIAFLVTLMIMIGNASVLVVTTAPGFGLQEALTQSQAQEYFLKVMPPGIDVNKAIDSNGLAFPGMEASGGDFVATAIDLIAVIGASIINIASSATYVFQFLVFLIVGYVFILQVAGVPSWFAFLISVILFPIQMFGLFYIATYLFSAVKGKL